MDRVDASVAWVLALVAGIGAGFQGADPLPRALAVLVALDVSTGVIRALVSGELNSDVSWRGGLKKLSIFLAVGLASVLDSVVVLGEAGTLRGATIAFYCAVEALSVIENLGLLGVPVPAQVRRSLEAFRDSSERPVAPKGGAR